MHELGITQSIVEICAERAAGGQVAAKVVRVTLEIGRLTAVMPDAIRFCFAICAEGTVLDGAALQIVDVPGKGRCRECLREMEMTDFLARCECGSIDIACIAGEGLRIKDMEVV